MTVVKLYRKCDVRLFLLTNVCLFYLKIMSVHSKNHIFISWTALTAQTLETLCIPEIVETEETVDTEETVQTEDLKKYPWLSNWQL